MRVFLKSTLSACLLSLSLAPSLSAGMGENLDKAFKQLGMSGNLTTPGAARDQEAGYYSGGSLVTRNKVNQVDLYNIQLPHYRAGCGGIDMFLGGFSYINGQQILNLFKQIGQNSAGFIYQLAMSSKAPQVKASLDEMLAKLQDATNMSINSCEAAATIVGGVWPQSDASSEILCNAIDSSFGKVSDRVRSRQKCGIEGERSKTNAQKNQKAEFKDMLGDQYNLAWKAIQKNKFLKSDTQLAEFFMTLSGTIISRLVKDAPQVHYIPGRSGDNDLIKALIQGNIPVKIWKCDKTGEDECLSPNTESNTVTLPTGKSLLNQVGKQIAAIRAKVKADTALNDEESGFVDSTMIPILQILVIETAYKDGEGPIHMDQYTEVIAYDILLQYLDDVLSIVEQSLSQLKQAQIQEEHIEQFRRDIFQARKLIFNQRSNLFQQMMVTMQIIDQTMKLEAKLFNSFVSHQQGTRVER